MKKTIFILCIALFLCSCGNSKPSPVDFKLGSSQKILEGYVVTSIAFDSQGNAWIGTQGQGLIKYNEKETVVYDSDNSPLPKDMTIWDVAVDKADNVWIAGEGAWKYDGEEFVLYNSQNTAMPEDIVWSIAVDSKNNIWFASCRFLLGGLVKYDGTTWSAYTPDNSDLPTNSIKGIAIDRSDNVWLALGDYVNQAYLARISHDKDGNGGKWEVFDENDLGFKPYYFGGIACDSKNRIWGALDYSLSSDSALSSSSPHYFVFDGKNATQLSCNDNAHIGGPRMGITIDHNDYAWCFGTDYAWCVGSGSGAWAGDQWMQIDFEDDMGIWAIKEDADYRMWFGTENGIYIFERD